MTPGAGRAEKEREPMNTTDATKHAQALAAITLAADYAAQEARVSPGTRAQYVRAGKLLYSHAQAHGLDFFRLACGSEPRELLALAAARSRDGECRVAAGYFRHLRGVAWRHLDSAAPAPAPADPRDLERPRRPLLARILRRGF